MTRQPGSATVWGVLSILSGFFMTGGGVVEVITYWPWGQMMPVVVGAIGAVVSAVLLMSGVAFCTRRSLGRPAAIAGAIGMASIHLLGLILGYIGIPGGIVGVAYPALLLLVLRANPNLGAPTYTDAGPGRIAPPPGVNWLQSLHSAQYFTSQP